MEKQNNIDFSSVLRRKFPHDPSLGMYVHPNLPASKLGKVLNDYTTVAPGDVVAFYSDGGLFSSINVVLTKTDCHYPDGSFPLEEVKSATVDGSKVIVMANKGGNQFEHSFKVKSDEAAKVFSKIFSEVQYFDGDSETDEGDYSKFSKEAVDWLEIRDEVMRTIDVLYEKFNDGKISLLDYEQKREELLSRL